MHHAQSVSKTLDVWIGLTGAGANATIFKWTHQGPITFTYWDQNQPSQPTEETSCVFYSGEVCVNLLLWFFYLFLLDICRTRLVHFLQAHMWRVGSCANKLPFMCQKKGEVNESAVQAGCSWKDVSIISIAGSPPVPKNFELSAQRLSKCQTLLLYTTYNTNKFKPLYLYL